MDEKIEEIEDIIYYLDELIDKIKFDKDLKVDLQQMKYAKEDELEELKERQAEISTREYEEDLKERNKEYWASQF